MTTESLVPSRAYTMDELETLCERMRNNSLSYIAMGDNTVRNDLHFILETVTNSELTETERRTRILALWSGYPVSAIECHEESNVLNSTIYVLPDRREFYVTNYADGVGHTDMNDDAPIPYRFAGETYLFFPWVFDNHPWAELGSVSTATLNPADLIPAFLGTLSHLGNPLADDLQSEWENKLKENADNDTDGNFLSSLYDELDKHAPPYARFGGNEGDPADIGYWLSFENEFDIEGEMEDDGVEIVSADWEYDGDPTVPERHVCRFRNEADMTYGIYWYGHYKEVWRVA